MKVIPRMLILAALLVGPLAGDEAEQARSRCILELRKQIEGSHANSPAISIPSSEEALRLLEGGVDPKAELWFLRVLIRNLDQRNEGEALKPRLARARDPAAASPDPLDRYLVEFQAAQHLLNQDHATECKAILDALKPGLEALAGKDPGLRPVQRLLGQYHRMEGEAFGRLNLLVEAIGTFTRAQRIFEGIGDREERARVLSEMGRVYRVVGRYDDAERTLLQAIAEAEALGLPSMEANFRIYLADTCAFRGEPDRQLAELLKAGQLAARVQDTDVALTVAVDLSDVYLRKGDYRRALAEADLALKWAREVNAPVNVAVSKGNRGIALNRLGQPAEGLRSLLECLDYFKGLNDVGYTTDITAALAEEYAFAGDYRKAFETQLALKALTDETDRKRIGAASAAFENDRHAYQIAAMRLEQRNQARLRGLWIALGGLGFATALGLVIGRRKLKRTNAALESLNESNLGLIEELGKALSEVKTIQGLIPICSYCKKIRDDLGQWGQMEQYIQTRSLATFSHGVCPECHKTVAEEWKAERHPAPGKAPSD